MKTEHVNAIVRFLRRLQPADLLLPAGAALVSAGLQRLVDREDRQRARLLALNELLDDHRQTLEANGVELPADRFGTEAHPLDIEGAVGIILARNPTEHEETTAGDSPSAPAKRGLSYPMAALVVGVAAWCFPPTRRALNEGATAIFDGIRPYAHGPRGPVTEEERAEIDRAHCRDHHVRHSHRPDLWWCCGKDHCFHNEPVGDDERLSFAHDVACNTVHTAGEECYPRDAEPPAPAEECGWPGCDWTSQSGAPVEGQRTTAALHRNRCIYRPPNAQVPE